LTYLIYLEYNRKKIENQGQSYPHLSIMNKIIEKIKNIYKTFFISDLIQITDDIDYKRKRILRMIVEFKNGNISTGTGFFINIKGNLLTCFHVISGGDLKILRQNDDFISITGADEHTRLQEWVNSKIKSINVELFDGSKIELELSEFNEQYDIALLKIKEVKFLEKIEFCELNFNQNLKYNDAVFFAGFPLNHSYTGLNTPFAINTGIVSFFPETEVAGGKYRHAQLNSINLGGNSGAPLFFKNSNKVIGIVNGNMNMGSDNILFHEKTKNQAVPGSLRIPLAIAYVTELKLIKEKSSIFNSL